MARYDGGYGGPRGGWRGQGGEMHGRGFPPRHERPYRRGGMTPGGGQYGGMRGGWDRGARGPWPGGLHGGMGGGRGEYGGAYEEYGGYPGGPRRGEYYGGPGMRRGYDGGYAREPFMPEEAYRRHPEYRQERMRRDWEAHQHEYGDDELGDDEVRDAVYRRMRADAWLDPDRIDVQVADGVVTLTGEVDDYMEARYAWDDAWEADGVRGVVNNLTVRADQPHDAHGDMVVQGAGDQTTAEDESLG